MQASFTGSDNGRKTKLWLWCYDKLHWFLTFWSFPIKFILLFSLEMFRSTRSLLTWTRSARDLWIELWKFGWGKSISFREASSSLSVNSDCKSRFNALLRHLSEVINHYEIYNVCEEHSIRENRVKIMSKSQTQEKITSHFRFTLKM